MRIISLTFSLLLIFCLQSQAQQDRCGTIETEESSKYLIANKAHWNSPHVLSSEPRFIPVTFHLIANNSGVGRISEDRVLSSLCLLNRRYVEAGVDIHFYLKDFNRINSTLMYDESRDAASEMVSAKDASSMNIYIVNVIPPSSPTSPGNTLGFYSPGGDFIVMQKANMGDAGYTIEHEIGHFFTLRHTHYGWEDMSYNPNDYPEKITFGEIGSSQTGGTAFVELVDRSNCELAGDLLCDTPADYGVGFECGCCVMPWTVLDAKCDTLVTMMNNIMSYSGNCDIYEFTDDQRSAINASYESDRRAYLRVNEVTEFDPIESAVELISPEASEKVETYDNVKLSWEPVPNAETYKVTVNNTDVYEVTDTEITITNLQPNFLFNQWSVQAFNKFGGGCFDAPTRLFATGTSSVAVIEIDEVSSFKLFPNPNTENRATQLELVTTNKFTADINLLDLSGKVVFTKRQVNIQQGDNLITLPTEQLTTGLYILEINSDHGKITEKLMIQD